MKCITWLDNTIHTIRQIHIHAWHDTHYSNRQAPASTCESTTRQPTARTLGHSKCRHQPTYWSNTQRANRQNRNANANSNQTATPTNNINKRTPFPAPPQTPQPYDSARRNALNCKRKMSHIQPTANCYTDDRGLCSHPRPRAPTPTDEHQLQQMNRDYIAYESLMVPTRLCTSLVWQFANTWPHMRRLSSSLGLATSSWTMLLMHKPSITKINGHGLWPHPKLRALS